MRISSGGSEFVNILESDSVTLRGNDKATNDGVVHSCMAYSVNEASKYSWTQLKNPASSGKTILVDKAIYTSNAAGSVLTQFYNTDLSTDYNDTQNMKSGGSVGVAQIRVEQTTTANLTSGFYLEIYYVLASTLVEITYEYPIILEEGKALCARWGTVNTFTQSQWFTREF